MSKLALIRDPRFQKHLTPDAHPETPQRLVAIDNVLAGYSLRQGLDELAPRLARESDIALVHKASYMEQLQANAERLQAIESNDQHK